MHTDDEIIAGCRENNRFFQNLLFTKYERRVFTICLRYAETSDDAKDIMQDAFIKVFSRIVLADSPIESLERWITRVAVNAALDHYRKVKRLKTNREEIVREFSASYSGSSPGGEEELLLLVQSLPASYRQVFNMAVIDGYAHKEISVLLGIPEGTSRTYLVRAREMLKEKMGHGKSIGKTAAL